MKNYKIYLDSKGKRTALFFRTTLRDALGACQRQGLTAYAIEELTATYEELFGKAAN
jgi:hypothetical protein